MNLVPRPVVSAITQTPASGPLLLVTTPPMSSLSIWTATGGTGWACGQVTGQAVNSAAMPTTTMRSCNTLVVPMWPPPRSAVLVPCSALHQAWTPAVNPATCDSAAVALLNPALGERLGAYVTLKPGVSLTSQELISFLTQKQIAIGKLPERRELLVGLPLTSIGEDAKN